MTEDFDKQQLDELLAAVNNNTITPENHERLSNILRQSSEARRRWFIHCDIETGLADWAAVEAEARSNTLPTVHNTRQANSNLRYALLGLVATLLIAATFTYWLNANRDLGDTADSTELPVQGVAILTHAVDVQWKAGTHHHVGSSIAPSMIGLHSGALLIEFVSGTSVVLEGPAELEILSANRARLQSGKLNAHVPPQAVGFTVSTPFGEIVDHGTEFGLTLPENSPRELHVFTGEVEVKSSRQSIDLQTGEAIQLGNEEPKIFVADRSAFLIEQDLIEQSRLEAERRFEQWSQESQSISEDPATLCHLRFERPADPVATSDRDVVDSAAQGISGVGGHLVGCELVPGRWPSKSGILFRRPTDRIRLTVDRPMDVVTLLAWVNVKSLPRWHNALLSADKEIPGAFRWQLTKTGQLRLEIARDLGRAKLDWEAVESPPYLTEELQRKWTLLVTSFDGKTIRHYVDGQLIGQGNSFTPSALHLGTAQVGNWAGSTRRDFHGIIDELVVAKRVLSETEIRRIYEIGKP